MNKQLDKYLEANKERIVGLDILRSIAILLVVYLHGIFYFPKEYFKTYIFPCMVVDGVSIFFVLSGYLIGGILIKIITNTDFTFKDLYQFWIRRWFRTLPTYYFVLLIYFTFLFITWKNLTFFNFSYIFFYHYFITPTPGSVYPEIWSLCVEEWFYLLFPLFLFFLLRLTKNKKFVLILSISLFILFPILLRILKYSEGMGISNFNDSYRKVVILRMDSLIYGIIGACVRFYAYDIWTRYKKYFLFFGLFLILFGFLYKKHGYERFFYIIVLSTSVEAIATLFLLPYFSELRSISNKYITAFFTFFSITSYSMYLLNLSPLQSITKWIYPRIGMGNIPWGLNYFLYWSLTIIASYLLNKYFEKPTTDLRDRYAPK